MVQQDRARHPGKTNKEHLQQYSTHEKQVYGEKKYFEYVVYRRKTKQFEYVILKTAYNTATHSRTTK